MIVAGFGFRASASLDSLRAALAATGHAPDLIATPTDKAGATPIRALATELGLPLHPVDPSALQAVDTATHSETVMARRGTGSVAEACALAAAGAAPILLTLRHISPDRLATCAIAQGSPS